MSHTTIRDIDVQKESPVAVEKYEESSFYLTALASATSQLVKAKTMKKVSGIEPLDIPVSKISGRSSGGKSDAFDEGDDEYDDDDDDDDFYEDDEDDDNNGYDDEDDNEDENEDNGYNENGRSSIGLGISEWRDITVANKTSSSKVDSGDAKEPLDAFQEAVLDSELSNTLTKKSSATHDKEKEKEKALTLSLVETIRRTSNYDKVFTLK